MLQYVHGQFTERLHNATSGRHKKRLNRNGQARFKNSLISFSKLSLPTDLTVPIPSIRFIVPHSLIKCIQLNQRK